MTTYETNPIHLLVGGKEMPATLSTVEAAALLGVDRQTLIHRRGTGKLPVEPLTLGAKLRWPTMAIAQALGLPVEIVGGDDATTLPEGVEVHDLAQELDSHPDPGGS